MLIHKDKVEVGDAIWFNNAYRTVCAKDIKDGGFMGRTIFGDSFKSGKELVKIYLRSEVSVPLPARTAKDNLRIHTLAEANNVSVDFIEKKLLAQGYE